MAEGYLWFAADPAGCCSQLKLTSILSSTFFMLIVYCVIERRAPSGNCSNHKAKSRLLCTIGDDSFIPYPITSLIVLSVSFIFCYVCTAVMGKRAGRWVGFI